LPKSITGYAQQCTKLLAHNLLRDLRFDNVPFRAGLILLQSDCLAGILFPRKSLILFSLSGNLYLKLNCDRYVGLSDGSISFMQVSNYTCP
jgi:hypothetical protein